MTVEKPLLLVDVDGVLNCFGNLGTSWVNFEAEFSVASQTNPHRQYRIKVPEGTRDRLARLAQQFEMVWATTWEDRAYIDLGQQLGITEAWPVIHFPEEKVGHTWKLPTVDTWVNNRSCAWIDDELHHDAVDWAKTRNQYGVPTLLVQTTPEYGLTEAQTVTLIDWAHSQSA